MFCKKCGCKNADSSVFCCACGAKLTDESDNRKFYKCPNCGEPTKAFLSFCISSARVLANSLINLTKRHSSHTLLLILYNTLQEK